MKVLIPKPDSWYVWENYLPGRSQLAGPFHDSGEPWQEIHFSKDELNSFVQGAHLYGESSVFHKKVDGRFFINPAISRMTPTGNVDPYSKKPIYKVTMSLYNGTSYTVETVIDSILNGSSSFGYADGSYAAGRFDLNLSHGTRTCYARYIETVGGKHRYIVQNNGRDFTTTTPSTVNYRYGQIGPTIDVFHKDKNSKPAAQALARDNLVTTAASTLPGSGWLYKYFLPEKSLSMDVIRQWINKTLHPGLLMKLPSLSLQNWGDLTHAATGNLDALSANMIAFVKDLRNVKSLIPKLTELRKIKTHADNYLSYQYGVLPTISDLKAIVEAFSPTKFYSRTGFRRVSAYDTKNASIRFAGTDATIYHSRRVHVAVNDKDTGLDALVERIRSIGFLPSLTNIWDLVPYSFVIDWFVDVGSVLERIDTKHRLLNLDIPYVIKTDHVKINFSLSDASLGVGSELIVSSYDRHVTTDIPQPRIFGEIAKPPTAQNHWVEGSALILQRTKN